MTRSKLQLKPEKDHLLRILYKQFGITTDNPSQGWQTRNPQAEVK